MNGVTLLMAGLKRHETCSLIGQFGLNLIHHSLIFVFCGYITWWLVFIILPPAGPSHMELSKTVCSDIGPLRRRLWNPARFLSMCVCMRMFVCVCAYVCNLPGTMTGCIVTWWAIMHAVCVFGGQVLVVSVLWRTAWISYRCTPCVFMCAFVTEAGDQIKFLTLEGFCQPPNTAAWLKAAVYCFSQTIKHQTSHDKEDTTSL